MFDIGFAEILVIAVISLVVLGPERLPGALRTTGLWVGRIRRGIRDIKSDIEREVGADEIRRQLHNEEVMRSLERMDSAKSSIYDMGESMLNDVKNTISAESGKPSSDAPKETSDEHAAPVKSDDK